MTRSVIEWLVAVVVIAGAAWFLAPVVGRWIPRAEDPVTVVEGQGPDRPPGVAPAAEPVPFLMLPDGVAVRVGLLERDLEAALPPRWRTASQLAETGPFGERRILSYTFENTRFWVVLDRTAPDRERQVTAIYVR